MRIDRIFRKNRSVLSPTKEIDGVQFFVREPDSGGGVTIVTPTRDEVYVTKGNGVFFLDPTGGEGWTIRDPETCENFINLANIVRRVGRSFS